MESEKERKTIQTEKKTIESHSYALLRETQMEWNNARYCEQIKVIFFKLLFEKSLDALQNGFEFTFVV